ncbi:hypothetical protein [Streptomyces sp. WAC05858]|uniref:hypothetical protein n=1 Tax=Streptomyces TaxID=1883 RepID=UPI000F76FC43|nr:hypothetical protein [Streptomyces sp. WAC05858]RSS47781.1 hypothetical protein EF902_08235 [Streptomyces sp. WAC05858]
MAVRLLLEDAAHNSIAPGRVTALARARDVAGRTVHRRIENARANGGTHAPAGQPHFEFTEHLLTVLARRHGNITRTHLELTAEAKTTPGKRKVPSRATFHRAVKRRLNSGQLAGLRGGEAARRSHDVFGKREHWPPTHPHQDCHPGDIHAFTLERAGKPLRITSKGVRWRKRDHLAPWMVGKGGEKANPRYMPHHDHYVELYEPMTGQDLGQAVMAN